MALLDRAGRVLSRIFGFRQVARQQTAKSIAESRLTKIVNRDRDALRSLQKAQEQVERAKARIDPFEELRQQIRKDQRKALREFEEELEKQRKDRWGLREEPSTTRDAEEVTEWHPQWVNVISSNVKRIRWVGGAWGLQVDFLNGYRYEYAVPYGTYLEMHDAGSKGKFVWWMRRSGIAYRRYNPTTIPPKIIYRWGHIGGPTSESDYQRPPTGESRGPRMFNPALGKPGAPI